MNPEAEARAKQQEFNAEMARRNASDIMDATDRNVENFVRAGNQQLAQATTVLGKTGNLGLKKNSPIDTGIDLGSENIDRTRELEDELATLNEEYENPEPEWIGGVPKYLSDRAKNRGRARQIEQSLDVIGDKDYEDMSLSDGAMKAGGSDLVHLQSTRDLLEQKKRDYVRSSKKSALNLLEHGDQMEEQADYTRQASNWNTASTFLNLGMSALTFGKNMEWF